MPEKRRGLGRGLGALIPSSAEQQDGNAGSTSTRVTERGRPVDLFFPTGASNGAGDRSSDGGERDEPSQSSTRSSINKEALTAPSKRQTGRNQAGLKKQPPNRAAKAKPEPTGQGTVATPADSAIDDQKTDQIGITAEPALDAAGLQTSPGEATTLAASDAVELQRPAAKEPSPVSRVEGASPGSEAEPGEDKTGIVDAGTDTADDVPPDDVSRETLREVPGARFAELPIDSIHPNRKQPRNVFDEDEMAELVHSVREIGVLQPVVVRVSPEGGEQNYELVMGERRWRASKEAGLETVPAIIRDTTDDDLLRDALLENLHRSQLNPLEEAAAYQQLLEDFGCSQEELAVRIGRSRPQISNTLRLMKLPPLVQRRLAAGVLSAGHARALLGLSDPAEMEKLAQRIVAEGLSVRSTEEIVAMSDGLRRPSKPSSPRVGARHERLDYLATSLSDRLDTSVKITLGAKKGRVSIEFASVDDLNRIMGVLAPTP
ncbi:ParB/RepB/Spo0J family partition protein [Arthrobacter sp. EH-1B-1]|uniref:ParB/RepB/Spo0J family partition protein n=1 Tax=Arthrobacter vasquezii TaxID=2977629 RepID=A0ABT6CUF4_9MICC|nr:ParB/RepB/Spo0J family partition protein [Arthrobacter vasquezii]MDF9277520.1 ParB/RepB/Spo0J family partition protein [Arthrobacter vasquezii]